MSTVSVAEANRQLSQLINRAAYGRDIVVITSRGQAKAVLLGMDAFDQLVGMEAYSEHPLPPINEFRQRFQEALTEAGYVNRDDILALTESVRQERAQEVGSLSSPQ